MNGISGLNAYYSFSGGGSYGGSYGIAAAVRKAQASGQMPTYGTQKAAATDAPVTPVRPARPVTAEAPAPVSQSIPSWNLNAAEEAVRMRIQYNENMPQNPSKSASPLPNTSAPAAMNLPESAWGSLPSYPGMDAGETAVRMRIQYPGADEKAAGMQLPGAKDETAQPKVPGNGEPVGAEGVQKAAEEGKCETCEQRKYQDGSDDMSVSFQTPTRIAPENVASAVRGHEMEHVSHEQSKAQQEGRKVVSQSVTLHWDICPECGKSYISGGTTRTVTAAKPEQPVEAPKQANQAEQKTPAGIA